jgi:hypothetical protein
MNLLFRFLLALLIALVRLLLPVLLVVFRALRHLVSMSFAATVHGTPQFIDRLAAEWTRRILEGGVPLDHIDPIYRFCRVVVGVLIMLGWLVSTFFTVEMLRIVFGFFI